MIDSRRQTFHWYYVLKSLLYVKETYFSYNWFMFDIVVIITCIVHAFNAMSVWVPMKYAEFFATINTVTLHFFLVIKLFRHHKFQWTIVVRGHFTRLSLGCILNTSQELLNNQLYYRKPMSSRLKLVKIVI